MPLFRPNRLAHAVAVLGVLSVPVHAYAEHVVLEPLTFSIKKNPSDSAIGLNKTHVFQKKLQQSPTQLGDALAGEMGIHANQFGGGASAPVIRGQETHRNKVSEYGADVVDLSHTSPDHAMMVNATTSKQIDVVQGLETLRYGSGITGAVIDVKDTKILTQVPEAFEADVGLRVDSGNKEKLVQAGVRLPLGSTVALSVQGASKNASDYKVPSYTYEDDHHETVHANRVPNTMAKSTQGSVGLSWVGERGFVGVAFSDRKDDYGLPAHSHEYHSCHTHFGVHEGFELHCGHHDHDHHHGHNHNHGHSHGHDNHNHSHHGHSHDHHGHNHDHDHEHAHEHEHEHAHPMPKVDLHTKRYDVRTAWFEPFAGVENLSVSANYTRYKHAEKEGAEALSHFKNNSKGVRVELDHQPIGKFDGIIGASYHQNTLSITGEEELLKENTTKKTGLFALETMDLGKVQWQMGGRLEHHAIDSTDNRVPDYKKTAYGYGTSLSYQPNDTHTWQVSLTHDERVPSSLELYARGLHLASNTYEWGDEHYNRVLKKADEKIYNETIKANKNDFIRQYGVDKRLDKEKSNRLELAWHYDSDKLDYVLKGFYIDYQDYIYAKTLDKYKDFRLIRYTQDDAKFYGVEGAVDYKINPNYEWRVFGDYVRGDIAGQNAPRVPSARLGARLNANLNESITAHAEYAHHFAQSRFADFESKTPAHDLLNVGVAYASKIGNKTDYRIFFNANNLLDEHIYSHSSFLSSVPKMGRSFVVGVNVEF